MSWDKTEDIATETKLEQHGHDPFGTGFYNETYKGQPGDQVKQLKTSMEANCLVLSQNKINCFFLQYIIKLDREN